MRTSIYNGNNFYVYLITDLNPIGTERYYIGSATRKELSEKNINPEEDTYYGSSTIKHFRALQNSNSPQLERIIIKTFSSKNECRLMEEHLIKSHNAVRSSSFYNISLPNSKFIGTSETAFKGAQTKRDDVDALGFNGLQRSGQKSGYT